MSDPGTHPETRPICADQKSIRPEWVELFRDFPDRFVIGTDQFYGPPGSRQIGPQKTEATSCSWTFYQQIWLVGSAWKTLFDSSDWMPGRKEEYSAVAPAVINNKSCYINFDVEPKWNFT